MQIDWMEYGWYVRCYHFNEVLGLGRWLGDDILGIPSHVFSPSKQVLLCKVVDVFLEEGL